MKRLLIFAPTAEADATAIRSKAVLGRTLNGSAQHYGGPPFKNRKDIHAPLSIWERLQ